MDHDSPPLTSPPSAGADSPSPDRASEARGQERGLGGEADLRTAEIKFCVRCGHAVEYRPVQGALRPVCPNCQRIHYLDPKVAVALVIEREGRLLLIKRNQNPEKGKWSAPAGFVDAGEDPARAAEREALEETGLQVRVVELMELLPKSDPVEVADILLVYRAEIVGGVLNAGDDADLASFFGPDDIPAELAFGSAHHITARWKAGQA